MKKLLMLPLLLFALTASPMAIPAPGEPVAAMADACVVRFDSFRCVVL